VDDFRGLCPSGWHVPSDAEFTTLTDFLGGELVAGGKMKEAGYDHWNSPNTGADNSSGFTAMGSGYRGHSYGNFGNLLNQCYFWSSTSNGGGAWYRSIYSVQAYVIINSPSKRIGLAVRCLSD
jgi:uncharacterized protein (TIGR02145 family)